ncbi:hypothetical protein DEA8626_02905 [Defluviimonas aquaemixtae]|uniref:Uncharacterized protein n=1 Tax=Albidovulum aquaemixtae TaxID=1542388 RepID=A0A2R8BKJ1_9RHOB|nr:hypothetical protein DEA8626_02905 [Defluviimonas aquaemixtae]
MRLLSTLLAALSLVAAPDLHDATGGTFDPTVQPLWRAMATGGNVEAARRPVGWGRVRPSAREMRLDPGMAPTFNGVAQRHAADRSRRAPARGWVPRRARGHGRDRGVWPECCARDRPPLPVRTGASLPALASATRRKRHPRRRGHRSAGARHTTCIRRAPCRAGPPLPFLPQMSPRPARFRLPSARRTGPRSTTRSPGSPPRGQGADLTPD